MIMKCLLWTAGTAIRYMLMSSPSQNMIFYTKLNNVEEEALSKAEVAYPLISSAITPRGVAYDQKRQILYVAESGTSAIVGYIINHMGDGVLGAEMKVTVHNNAEATWLAADSKGNLFYSSPVSKELKMIDAISLQNKFYPPDPLENKDYKEEPIKPVTLYGYSAVPPIPQVQTPHGLYVDDFHVYWINGNSGEGVVVRGLEYPSEEKESDIKVVQTAGGNGYAVCGSPGGLYYTTNGNVFLGSRNKDDATVISTTLLAPRGCEWDGDGMMWVADKSGKIVRFSADMKATNIPREIVMHIEDPFDLTLIYFSGASMPSLLLFLMVFVF